MRRVFVLCLLAGLAACGDNGTCTGALCDVTFELFVWGDAGFQGPHAGQDLTFAFIGTTDGAFQVDGGGSGPIFAAALDTISFGFGSTVQFGETYELHLWIDSNVGGGTEGVCDPPAIDHQWIVAVPAVMGDVNLVVSHDDATVTDVCSTFELLEQLSR